MPFGSFAGRFVEPIPLTLNDCGMDDPVQFCPGLRVTETISPRTFRLMVPSEREDVFTKSLNHGCMDRLTGPKEFMSDPVRIEEMASELDET